MQEILNRYKVFFILLSIIVFILMLWLFITGIAREKKPVRGVFVIERQAEERMLKG